MRSNWKLCKLKEIINIKHGYAFKGAFFTDIPNTNLILTPGNFKIGGGFKYSKGKYYTEEYPIEYKLNPGDVIVTMTDLSKAGDTLGYSAKIPYSEFNLLHNQRLGLVENLAPEEVDLDFIYWLLRRPDYQKFIVNGATGSTVRHTSPSRILEFEFELPPPEEQKKIADILSELEKKIELNESANTVNESISQTLFRSWFVDFDPVKAKIEAKAKGGNPQEAAMQTISGKSLEELKQLSSKSFQKLAETADLFPDELIETEQGDIPKGWRFSTIGDETSIYGGGTPSTKEKIYWNGRNWWATPKDMSKLKDKVLIETDRKITDEGVSKISSGILPIDTVLMSSRAPVGYLAISKIPISINQGFIAMVCDKKLTSEYIIQWAEQKMNEITQRASGTTFLEISKKNFKPIQILVPSGEVLKEYSSLVKIYYEIITTNVHANNFLEAIIDLLLPRLLNQGLKFCDDE
ncbi:restriction endonuclease subunit S [Leeuwenhoekiella aestuarii]|uniref:Type I restriction enzyme S subunit n=1 Tax=Leeuwenhoekiella aestuarii TaxID=2249426 RepID=A0A4Q0NS49_9FLAO|nr:restriction endonuclease subunit S [Leeuwenhoekiella aestuarii]RXG13254.1 type I restriction enzyme S subunit [Leeuwenhoekiella aestuarii]